MLPYEKHEISMAEVGMNDLVPIGEAVVAKWQFNLGAERKLPTISLSKLSVIECGEDLRRFFAAQHRNRTHIPGCAQLHE